MKVAKGLILISILGFFFYFTPSSLMALEVVQLTNDNLNDTNPKINDNGQIVWVHSVADSKYSREEVVLYEDGDQTTIPPHEDKYIYSVYFNDVGHIATMNYSNWFKPTNTSISIFDGLNYSLVSPLGLVNDFNNGYLTWSEVGGGLLGNVYLYDGISNLQIGQGVNADVNENGHAVWVAGQINWWPGIGFYDGLSSSIIDDGLTPSINDNEQIAWISYTDAYLHLLSNGTDNLVQPGYVSYRLNNLGQIVYLARDNSGIYQLLLYESGNVTMIADNINGLNVSSLRFNDKGHIVWAEAQFDYPANSYVYALKVFDGKEVVNIFDRHVAPGDLDINNDGEIVWAAMDGNDYDIFTTKISNCDPFELVDSITAEIMALLPDDYKKYDANLKKIPTFLENGLYDAAIGQLNAVADKLSDSDLDENTVADLLARLNTTSDLINNPCPN